MSSTRTIMLASLIGCCAAMGNNATALAEEKTSEKVMDKVPEKKDAEAGDAQKQLNKALNKAASLGKVGEVKDLLKRGADIQWRDQSDNGKTPLVKAILGERFEVVKFLLANGADINYPDGSGRYPVYFCCLSKKVDMLKYLLEKGGDKDLNRGPASMLVSLCDHGQGTVEMIPILIKAGISPDVFKENVTPLIAAIQLDPKVRKPEIARSYIKALIENKADVNLKDKKGQSPLEWARERGDREIIEMLEKAGAKDDTAEPGE